MVDQVAGLVSFLGLASVTVDVIPKLTTGGLHLQFPFRQQPTNSIPTPFAG